MTLFWNRNIITFLILFSLWDGLPLELSSKHLVNATSLPLASSKEIFTKKSEILFLIPMSVIIFSNIEFAWGSRPVSKIKMIYCSSWPTKKQRENYSFRHKICCNYKQISKICRPTGAHWWQYIQAVKHMYVDDRKMNYQNLLPIYTETVHSISALIQKC